MVNCHCGKAALHGASVQNGADLGRWYYKCTSSRCTFFQWDDATARQQFQTSPVAPKGQSLSRQHQQQQHQRGGRFFISTQVTFGVHSTTQICLHMRNSQHLTDLLRGIATYENGSWMIPATRQAYDRAVKTLDKDTSDSITRINPLPPHIVNILPVEDKEDEDDGDEESEDEDVGSEATTDDGQEEEESSGHHDQQSSDKNKSEQTASRNEQENDGDDENEEVDSDSNPELPKRKNKGKGRATHVSADDNEEYQEEEGDEDDGPAQRSTRGDRQGDEGKQISQKERLRDIQDSGLWCVLKDFQRKAVAEAIKRDGRMLLGDEMGLGKTIQAIAVAYAYLDSWPVLIICPSSLRFTWKNEIMRWIESVNEDDIHVITKGPQMADLAKHVNNDEEVESEQEDEEEDVAKDAKVSVPHRRTRRERKCKEKKMSAKRRKVQKTKFWVVSYDIATNQIDYINQAKFKFIICDESHYLKGLTTLRTRSIVPALKKCKHVLLLSGTPAFSKPVELFSQCNALRPDIFSSLNDFGMRYCGGSNRRHYRGSSALKGATNLQELNLLLTQTVLVRRLKDDVGIELPPKTRQTVFMDVAASVKRAMKKNNAFMQKTLREMDNPDKSGASSSSKGDGTVKLELMLQMYTDTANAKIPVVKEYLDHVLKTTDQKMIIVAHHRSMLDAIEECVISKEIGYIRIDGSTKPDERQQMCDRYQAKKSKVQVAILSLSIGVGLTLSAADMVLFAELHWTPSTLLQAEDRAHRIGRRGPVNIVYILAPDTLDGYLWQLIKKKLSIVGAAIDGTPNKVTINEASSSGFDWLGDEEQSVSRRSCGREDDNNEEDGKDGDDTEEREETDESDDA